MFVKHMVQNVMIHRLAWLMLTLVGSLGAAHGAPAANAPAADVVLLDFQAEWCAQCQQMKPDLQRLVSAGYPLRTVDVDREPALARRFQVTRVPTFVVLVDGREVDRTVGITSVDRLQRAMTSAAQSAGAARDFAPQPASQPPLRSTAVRPEGLRAQQIQPSASAAWQGPNLPAPLNALLAARGGATVNPGPPVRQRPLPPAAIQLPPQLAATPERPRMPSTRNVAQVSRPINEPVDSELAERLTQATVRLRIGDDTGRSTGTGTIIDSRQGEALVLTCGHVFRSSGGRGEVFIDLFQADGGADERYQNLPATLISYDLKADIGLLSFRTDADVVVAPLAPLLKEHQRGAAVLSLGCDHGENPTIRRTRITHLNKFLGPDNIEIAGQPVQGRSGGGLFNTAGELIGVCNAADPEDDEGLFAAVSSVHKELKRLGIHELVIAKEGSPTLAVAAGDEPATVARVAALGSSRDRFASPPPAQSFSILESKPTTPKPGPIDSNFASAATARVEPVRAAPVQVAIASPDPAAVKVAFNEPIGNWSPRTGPSPAAASPPSSPPRPTDGPWQPRWVKKQL